MAASKATKQMAKALSAIAAEASSGRMTPEQLATIVDTVRLLAAKLEGILRLVLEESLWKGRENGEAKREEG